MKQRLIDRLTRYVKVDTQADAASESTPSTEKQWDLIHILEEEIKALNLEVDVDDKGYLMATLPSNTDKDVPTIGLLAHIDTSPDYHASNVNPVIVEQYNGENITLGNTDKVLSTKTFPQLEKVIGHTLMTTDGTTLLGADDKAGVVEIMEAIIYLLEHPEIKHGKIRFSFTPDEEIGRGPHHFDVERFNADFAYTLDGSLEGELQYESFNAASAVVEVNGVNVHPGSAKDVMVNANTLAMAFNDQLPSDEVPEHTEGYEGFYHLSDMTGTVEKATLQYIIRDHDKAQFERRKNHLLDIAKVLNHKYDQELITVTIKDQYYNMGEKIKPQPELVNIPEKVIESLGMTPIIEPIRGGTDGSQLSFMGLPTPNLFTGGANFHGPYEYASIDVMEKAVHTIVGIVSEFEQQS
ncbi:peptidase T [Mammaliicoccus sciuri]|uniref:peptidase T n=1 Tax=Mammaliicoccus sciuri TaxID=1296 RepID=UPI0009FC2615|nr:peptidase T [Mammaliicoccus sciuri]PCQ21541.1 peptidase T [Klebsiella pneumoniae]MCD8860594.1 peptidase T [Mammaliicoccus sciuri]MEB7733342.1 peptidase T [Mammaliicoccus sciuri]MEB7768453.1 peptidase T [Mammaliicoccus sciuri]MEB7818890.1 peptidase T [Mammaliicoccus sciuri]